MLSPLQWVVRKGKGRICVDCTNVSRGVNSPGSPNTVPIGQVFAPI